jgi:hypothetical protein
LTRDLLRGPAHSLREELEEVRWDLGAFLGLAPSAPLLVYASYLAGNRDAAPPASLGWSYAIAGVLASAWAFRYVFQKVKALRDLRLGMEAELATAEELNRLMHDGFWVFHDVPGEKRFNVDHVVVGPTGVFAIETKGRPKPTGKAIEKGHEVHYDGKSLAFPGWRETAPLQQAERNAMWLRKWLSSAVGEPVAVQPVLVLPGWYVHRTSGEGMPVLNGKEAKSYFPRHGGKRLSDKLIQQIVHQLDQRCRDVEPKAA